MTKETAALATRPFKSFAGIVFPIGYSKKIIKEGDILDLGNRELLILSIPDHAAGSIALLDKKERLLFTGDELMEHGKRLNGGVRAFLSHVEKLLQYKDVFDRLCGGAGVSDVELLFRYRDCLNYILDGHEGEPLGAGGFEVPKIYAPDGSPAYDRRLPHPEDIPPEMSEPERQTMRVVEHAGLQITYDLRKQIRTGGMEHADIKGKNLCLCGSDSGRRAGDGAGIM